MLGMRTICRSVRKWENWEENEIIHTALWQDESVGACKIALSGEVPQAGPRTRNRRAMERKYILNLYQIDRTISDNSPDIEIGSQRCLYDVVDVVISV